MPARARAVVAARPHCSRALGRTPPPGTAARAFDRSLAAAGARRPDGRLVGEDRALRADRAGDGQERPPLEEAAQVRVVALPDGLLALGGGRGRRGRDAERALQEPLLYRARLQAARRPPVRARAQPVGHGRVARRVVRLVDALGRLPRGSNSCSSFFVVRLRYYCSIFAFVLVGRFASGGEGVAEAPSSLCGVVAGGGW